MRIIMPVAETPEAQSGKKKNMFRSGTKREIMRLFVWWKPLWARQMIIVPGRCKQKFEMTFFSIALLNHAYVFVYFCLQYS
jgi:hypothetical protein